MSTVRDKIKKVDRGTTDRQKRVVCLRSSLVREQTGITGEIGVTDHVSSSSHFQTTYLRTG